MAEYKEAPAERDAGQKLLNWVDNRFPATKLWNEHVGQYYAPKNFNFWYIFGSLSLLVLVIQIVTGIFLVMHYKPDASLAFASVEYIMRDVPWGWLIRYMHSTGASAFFIVVYLHMFRGLLYGSYRKPRELVWIFGCAIFLCLMAEAFMGYLLPWGQMSYWGAQVIINLFAAFPSSAPTWRSGSAATTSSATPTPNRFFSFHVIAVPLVLLGLVWRTSSRCTRSGRTTPTVSRSREEGLAGPPARRYPVPPVLHGARHLRHERVPAGVHRGHLLRARVRRLLLEYNNFIPADPLKTPSHIAPVWYFTPFYSMLRATTDLMIDVLCVILAVAAIAAVVKGRFGLRQGRLVVAASVAIVAAQDLRRQVLGRGRDGRRGDHPVLPALARPQPGQVDPLPPGWHKYVYGVFVCSSWCSATSARSRRPTSATTCRRSARCVLRLLPADAVVEPARRVQARARPRDLRRPLTRGADTMKKISSPCCSRSAVAGALGQRRRLAWTSSRREDDRRPPRCSTARSCSSTTA
jgi:ubiquinol-cytochrome c reductase cytochrome b subunit